MTVPLQKVVFQAPLGLTSQGVCQARENDDEPVAGASWFQEVARTRR